MSYRFFVILGIFSCVLMASQEVIGQETSEKTIYSFVTPHDVDRRLTPAPNHSGKDFLGPQVGAKMAMFRDTYSFIEKGSPSSPGDKTVIRKPSIYYGIRKLSKHFKKEVKSGRLTQTEAASIYISIIDKGLLLIGEDTPALEKELWAAKKPIQILDVFDRVKFE
jgi:hypothetical protein